MRLKKIVLLSFMLCFLMLSCNNSDEENKDGVLNIILVDSPASYQKITIDIEAVLIHLSNSAPDVGWIAVNREPIRNVDLLTLRNGNYKQLVLSKVPAGKYDKIKLQFGPCTITENNTSVFFEQNDILRNGFIQNHNFEISSAKFCELAFDIDVYKSVTKNGVYYYFTPKFRVQDVSLTGWIKGTIVNKDKNPVNATVFTLVLGDTVSTLNDSTKGGSFVLSGIPADTYQITVVPLDLSTYQKVSVDTVIVKPKLTTNVGEIILQ